MTLRIDYLGDVKDPTLGPPMLFDDVEYLATDTPAQRFQRFHEANPEVYLLLRDLAFTMKRRGHKRVGIAMLFEQLRWSYFMATTDVDGYKLNNNYKSHYARLLMKQEPELTGFFTTREKQ